jgi:peptidoglycan/LPS O-acetylase OafA/YrhL
MGTARGHSNWLVVGDPLRGIAAFGVLLFHVATWAVLQNPGGAAVNDLGPAGPILFNLDAGVFLFFLLSGYLIGRPFASAFVLQTPFPHVGRYVLRRTLRLGPGVVAATALAVVLFGPHYERGTIHFWTLGAEASFYAVLPVLVAVALSLARRVRGPRVRAALWVAATSVLSVASLWFRGRGAPLDFGHQHVFPAVAFAFAPGLALAGLEPVLAPAVRAAPTAARGMARGLAFIGALAAIAYFDVPRSHFMQHSVLAVGACGAVLAATLVRAWAELPAWRLLDNRTLQWLGERSYSLYLFHLPVVAFVAARVAEGESAPGSAALVALVAIPTSLVLAWAGYALVERPFMRPRRQRVAPEPADRLQTAK